MILTIVLLSILLVVASYLAYANYKKYQKAVEYAENGFFVYNRFIADLYDKFKTAENNMKVIDHRGSFRADDEVGMTFEALKSCIEELDEYLSRYVDGQEEN